jgi:hypothetical protein
MSFFFLCLQKIGRKKLEVGGRSLHRKSYEIDGIYGKRRISTDADCEDAPA